MTMEEMRNNIITSRGMEDYYTILFCRMCEKGGGYASFDLETCYNAIMNMGEEE